MIPSPTSGQSLVRLSRPGDASYIAYLHMKFYERQHNFRGIFEHYVLAGLSEFIRHPQGSRLWIAEVDGCIAGSIAIVKTGEQSAQLRWFLVEDSCRGMGLGRQLMDTAMAFCRERKYRHVFLWTIAQLEAARHLYKAYGFLPTQEKSNSEWTGSVLTEERWDWTL